MRRIRQPQGIIFGAQLGAELALADEVKLLGHGLVRVLQHLDLGSGHVVARRERGRRASTKSQGLDTGASGCLNSMRDDVFDGAVGGAGEVEAVLDLHAVAG